MPYDSFSCIKYLYMIYESEKWKWSHSVVSNSVTPWIVAYQAPPSMGFSRQDITFPLGSVLLVFFPPRLQFTVNSNQLLLLFGFIFFSLPIEADPGRFSRYHSLILFFTNGVLWFMGSQRVGHDWATELNWINNLCNLFTVSTQHIEINGW